MIFSFLRLCGYPPFYSNHGQAMSPGMKKRIRTGQYDFPVTEWKHVSNDAKSLIRSLLQTEAVKRPDIDQVMQNKWIAVSWTFLRNFKTHFQSITFPLFSIAIHCCTSDTTRYWIYVKGRGRGVARSARRNEPLFGHYARRLWSSMMVLTIVKKTSN